MDGGSVKIDAEMAAPHHLRQEKVGEPRRKRAVSRAGERPVEVSAVRQIARAADEAVSIDNGDGEQCTGDGTGIEGLQDTTDYLDTVQFVAVDGGGNEHCRPGSRSMQHVHRQGNGGVVRQLRNRQVDELALACGTRHARGLAKGWSSGARSLDRSAYRHGIRKPRTFGEVR